MPIIQNDLEYHKTLACLREAIMSPFMSNDHIENTIQILLRACQEYEEGHKYIYDSPDINIRSTT